MKISIYKPVYEKSDVAQLRIWMMPVIVNTNICINVNAIGDKLILRNGITGISTANRQINYTSKKIRTRNNAIAMNILYPKKQHVQVNTLKHMYHSFNLIVEIPKIAKLNLAIFGTGKIKISSTTTNDLIAAQAAKIVCNEIMTQFEMSEGNTWWYIQPVNVIYDYISSKKTNQPTLVIDDTLSETVDEIKQEIKNNIEKYNNDHDKTMKSLKGILGFSDNYPYNAKCIVISVFPTTVRAQCSTKYRINSQKIYRFFIEKGYIANYQPQLKSKVTVEIKITKNYSQKIDINPTGMITFGTKTVTEIYQLYELFKKLINDSKGYCAINDNIEESSDSDDDNLFSKTTKIIYN